MGLFPKSEVFDMFLAYKALFEKLFGYQIIKLRSDNGGEYVNKNFTTLCTKYDIQQQHISPYTPEQNGVVEWKNQNLKEIVPIVCSKFSHKLCKLHS